MTALLETTLSARELLALRRGDVIALGHSANNPLDVHVGTVPRFAGRLMRQTNGVGVVVERFVGGQRDQVEGKVA